MIGQTLKIPGGKARAGLDLPDIDLESEPAVGLPAALVEEPGPAVPAVEEPAIPEPAAAAAPAVTGNVREHVVGEGEDLYSVSLMWDVSVARLKDVNGLTDTTLKPGQVLQVPLD